MTLIRTLSWALLLSAAALAGPNLPAQGLAALRETIRLLTHRLFVRSDTELP